MYLHIRRLFKNILCNIPIIDRTKVKQGNYNTLYITIVTLLHPFTLFGHQNDRHSFPHIFFYPHVFEHDTQVCLLTIFNYNICGGYVFPFRTG